jgi:hypothetical protein
LRAGGLSRGAAAFHGGPRVTANPVCSNPSASYFGGPVMQSPTVVAVFWTSSVNATLRANITQFYDDVMQSPLWTVLQEYDSVGHAPGTAQAILPGHSGGGFVITPLKCAPGGANCRLTDTDVQNELLRQIGLGVLPAPTLDCTGNANTIYMVDFPPNVSLSEPAGAARSCAVGGFCGYHNTGTYGATNIPLVYGAVMDVFTGPCATGCAATSGLQAATTLHSHELVEAVTDPDIGLDVQATYAAPAAWADNDNACGELADICDDGSAGDDITVAGRTWKVQQIWSNSQRKCTSTATALPACAGTTTSGCRRCSCGDADVCMAAPADAGADGPTSFDAGPIDGGARADGAPPDAPAAPDDAATNDAASADDAGAAVDAVATLDGGGTPDAAAPFDAASELDAVVSNGDVGATGGDAGADARDARSAGPDARADDGAAQTARDAATGDDAAIDRAGAASPAAAGGSGCGCEVGPSRAPGRSLCLFTMLALLAFRRRTDKKRYAGRRASSPTADRVPRG